MPDLAVVIPTKDGGALFGDVLGRLRAQKFDGTLEIIVIDSGSRDETLELCRKFDCRVKEIDPATFNHGRTRNEGCAMADAPIIVLLTQDAVPADEHLLTNLYRCFDDPAVAGAYARQIPRENADVLTRRNVVAHLTGRDQREEQYAPDWEALWGAHPMERYVRCNFDNVCSAVRKSVWHDHAFEACDFGEDLQWSRRVMRAGQKIVYQPTAAVVHSHDRSARYEYKRTYMCHRKLYELFELATVPTRRHVLRSIVFSVVRDGRYVLKNEPCAGRRVRLLARIPILAVASALGQFRGARDQRLTRGKRQPGV